MILTIEISVDKAQFSNDDMNIIREGSMALVKLLDDITAVTRVDYYKDGLPLVFVKKFSGKRKAK